LHSFLRAALASAYSIQDSSIDGLTGAWQILRRVQTLMDAGDLNSLEMEADSLPELSDLDEILNKKNRNYSNLRNDLLDNSNLITSPTPAALTMLRGVTLSAFLITRLGQTCTLRTAGEMMLLQDLHEQKSEFLKVVRLLSNTAPRDDDTYWSRARNDIIWLHSWGTGSPNTSQGIGPFGMIPRHDLETEILKAMLANSRT
jgi:hypothetical protein